MITGDSQVARLVAALAKRTPPSGTPILELRQDMEDAVARMPIADGVRVTSTEVGGRPAEWITPTALSRNQIVVWFHGGGYVMGSPATVRPMASLLAVDLGGAVLTPDYRLAPEHPFPAAVRDASAVYEELIEKDHRPADIALAGDSAGGGLVLAALIDLRDRGVPLPSAAVCISPWVDMTSSGVDAVDPQVTAERLTEMSAFYLGATNPSDPLASPLHADLTGLPPLLVHVGGAERMAADGESLANNARRDGVDVTFESWPDMIHVWHAFAPRLDQGTAALNTIARWLGEHWDKPAEGAR